MMNPKDSAARTEVGPQNTIGVVMEDLPETERRAIEKELEEEMAEVSYPGSKKHRTEASIHVPRMFTSHAWQQYDKQMKCYE
jgi:hypothetical protein